MQVTLKGVKYSITATQFGQAREWVLNCAWCETEEELEELSDLQIVRGVEKHFCDGWQGFLETILDRDS